MKAIIILFLIFSIFIGSFASTCTNDEICKIDGSRIKILDPSLNMGKIECIDHGKYQKGCKDIYNINPICTLTPLENPTKGNYYHYFCKWQSMDIFNIEMKVNDEYDTIVVELYPKVDPSPFAVFLMFIVLICLWCYMIRSENSFFEGYAGGLLSSWIMNGETGYEFSSGTC